MIFSGTLQSSLSIRMGKSSTDTTPQPLLLALRIT
uniref:Glutathione peroxidase n=1 Tax=Rhizophora mucronata TaxID=61149 RepID=A0A2P2K5X9_RHIMU